MQRTLKLKSLQRLLNHHRHYHHLSISSAVSKALQTKSAPVVSLESTIITHGLPFPANLEMALTVEEEVRRYGLIPATTAFIDGVPKVGLNAEGIERLASKANGAVKVSRRDIPYVIAHGLNGGTTISSSMILSHKAGIKVFATGGLGGVHRDGQNTLDISADLDELSKTPVAVVCAGPKSILDIERTIEYLETKGVFVGTYGGKGMNIPGFYTRDSGVKSPYNFESLSEAARIIHSGNQFELESGYLFCVPPPEHVALDSDFINNVIEHANAEAIASGIKGKDLTPFLLKRINEETEGKSVKSNVEFVLNNVRAACGIATELFNLENNVKFTPLVNGFEANNAIQSKKPDPKSKKEQKKVKKVNSVVIGSIALDTHATIPNSVKLGDSNPSTITSSIGGVAYNVAKSSFKSGNDSLGFVSAVAHDVYAESVLSQIELPSSSSFITKLEGFKTSQYISFHDAQGELVIASSDMSIIEHIPIEYVRSILEQVRPKVVLVDCNVSSKLITELSKLQKALHFNLIIEPTSESKSFKISAIKNPIHLITPTIAELSSIYEAFNNADKFELDHWFPFIDSLSLDGAFRTRIEQLISRDPKYTELLSKGVIQQATALLPYVRHLLVKDGSNGVYHFTTHPDISSVEPSPYASFLIRSKSKIGAPHGVIFEHYDIPQLEGQIKNVTGAGDAFAGWVLKELGQDVEVLWGDKRGDVIIEGQVAAGKRIRGIE